MLLHCFASVVYHSDWLEEMGEKDASHVFNTIPILNDPELLLRLKERVTLKLNIQISQPTGVPPHVENAI